MPNELPLPPKDTVQPHASTPGIRSRIASPEDVTSPLLSPTDRSTDQKDTYKLRKRWRHTLGLGLLFLTVLLWTTSNFLASTLFADNTYSKPYLVTYVNTTFFIIPLIPILVRQALQDPEPFHHLVREFRKLTPWQPTNTSQKSADEDEPFIKPDSPRLFSRPPPHQESQDMLLQPSPESSQILNHHPQPSPSYPSITAAPPAGLALKQTALLSAEFALLWFLANYFVAACLSYTTVASSTILTSTSSIFTLLFGALVRVETFTLRKTLGVLASLAGVALISTVDFSGQSGSDENRGSFPAKSVGEIAVGDAMALLSAVLYGGYAVMMKARIGSESSTNMPLFFGLVGLFNVLFLWPGFILLHYTGIETFELPPTGRVTAIILVNSASSLVSDFCWAYAVLLTGPIVVTVGLSMTIPLSLVGQMVLNGQTAGLVYWIGALIVVGSFVVVNWNGGDDDKEAPLRLGEGEEGARGRDHVERYREEGDEEAETSYAHDL